MIWGNRQIAKGTNSIASVASSVLMFVGSVWLIALNINDPVWRWSVGIIGTLACAGSPGGLACLCWLCSAEFRKQWREYRRDGLLLPGYTPARPWDGSPVVDPMLKKYTADFKHTILGSHSEGFQDALKDEMYQSAASIYAADNPLMKCRQKLAYYVIRFADWCVLALKPEEKYGLSKGDVRQSPYISGELHRHLRYCAQCFGELAEFIAGDPIADDQILAWANSRTTAFQYLMYCMNVIRADVKDFEHPGWFQPFVKSMLICKEDEYRQKIGLPALLPSDMVRRHASFLDFVLKGAVDPLSQWEAIHKLKHSDVS